MVNKRVVKGRRLSVADRREHLVSVGLELIATRSWHVVTMSDIAAAANVSKPLLYHYFATRNDLYVESVRTAADQLRKATRPDPSLPPRERLRRSLEAHVDWVEENALGYRVILQGGINGDPAVQRIVEQSRSEVVQRVMDATGRGQPHAALNIALRGWVGFLEGACLEWLATKDLPKPALVRLLAASLPGAVAAANS